MDAVPSVSLKRFRDGYTFDEYLRYLASPVNLAREGYEGGTRLSPTQLRADLSREVADWYASFALTEPQVQSIRLPWSMSPKRWMQWAATKSPSATPSVPAPPEKRAG